MPRTVQLRLRVTPVHKSWTQGFPPTELGGSFGSWTMGPGLLVQIPRLPLHHQGRHRPAILRTGFSVAWGGSVRIFSRPGSGGSLSLNGGWLLFLVDTFGVWMFGDWWPVVATTFCSFLLALVAGLSVIVLHACSRLWCCRCLAWCCRRLARHEPQVELQETPEARGYRRLVLTGPGGVRAADTDYFQREVRGRGLNRKPHDLVVVLETGVARLQLDPERRSRIDRHGLWVHSDRVLGATTRRVRELVERAEQVHPCRKSDCQGGPGVHCACFAAVDAESLVDLGAYDRLTAWRLGVLLWRSIYSIGSALRRWWRIMGTSVASPWKRPSDS